MPLFLLFVMGILAYGMYFGASHSVVQLAADAARASVAGLSDSERADIARAHVASNAPSYLLIEPNKLEVEAGAKAGDPSQFDVAIAYDSSGLPIWIMSGLLPLPPKVIVRTASIKRGGY